MTFRDIFSSTETTPEQRHEMFTQLRDFIAANGFKKPLDYLLFMDIVNTEEGDLIFFSEEKVYYIRDCVKTVTDLYKKYYANR